MHTALLVMFRNGTTDRSSEVGKMDIKLLRFCLLLQIREPVHDISFEATKETNKKRMYHNRWSRDT